MVVAGAGDRGPDKVGVLIDSLYHRAEHSKEDGVLVRVCPRVEEVRAAVGDRPVVVLAAAVDARKGLLMQEADQSVAVRHLAEHFHNQHIVVAGEVQFLEHGSQFELGGGHFVVPRLGGDPQFPQFVLYFRHEVQDPILDGAEVMVLKLLMLGARRAEQCSAGQEQVRPGKIKALVDQEVLLLRSQRYGHFLFLLAEALHQVLGGLRQNLHGP